MSKKKVRLKTFLPGRIVGGRLHVLEEGKILEVEDLPSGSNKPRFWYIDVDGMEIGIYENEAEIINDE